MRRRSAGLLALLLLGSVVCDKATPVAPTGTTITLSVNPTSIAAQGEQATVTAIVRRDNGSPVNPGTEVNFSTSLGVIETTPVPTDDRGLAETVLRGAGQVGMATVTASSGAAADATAEVRIGSLADSLTLVATPSSLPRSFSEPQVIKLVATVRDDEGRLLNEFGVNFEAEVGSLSSAGGTVLTNTPCPDDPGGTGSPGVACDLLTVTEADLDFLQDVFFLVSAFASAAGGGLLQVDAEVDVAGGAEFLSLQATPASIRETGGSTELRALVQDDNGEPLDGVAVNFITEVGTLDSGGGIRRTDLNGEAIDTLTVTAGQIGSLTTTSFQVRARTVASDGTQLEATFDVRIQATIPKANFIFTLLPDFVVVFDASLTTGEPPLIYRWDFGDQSPIVEGEDQVVVEHQYADGTARSVTLTVSNEFGVGLATKTVTPQP